MNFTRKTGINADICPSCGQMGTIKIHGDDLNINDYRYTELGYCTCGADITIEYELKFIEINSYEREDYDSEIMA